MAARKPSGLDRLLISTHFVPGNQALDPAGLEKTRIMAWTRNRESFTRLFSKDYMVLWTLSHYASNKRKFEELMATDSYAHNGFVRLRSPKEAAALIQNLTNRDKQA